MRLSSQLRRPTRSRKDRQQLVKLRLARRRAQGRCREFFQEAGGQRGEEAGR